MRRPVGSAGRRPPRGVVMVETAFVLLFVLVLLPFPLLLGRYYWHAMVLEKVAHNGARYMSTVPVLDMKNTAKTMQAVGVVQSMAAAATADFSEVVSISVRCDNQNCGFFPAVPTEVHVALWLALDDPVFHWITLLAGEPLILQREVTMSYANN
jgi:Flp pilus assembly protein TadG